MEQKREAIKVSKSVPPGELSKARHTSSDFSVKTTKTKEVFASDLTAFTKCDRFFF